MLLYSVDKKVARMSEEYKVSTSSSSIKWRLPLRRSGLNLCVVFNNRVLGYHDNARTDVKPFFRPVRFKNSLRKHKERGDMSLKQMLQ